MSRPRTNCPPRIFIAWSVASLTVGSPIRCVSFASQLAGACWRRSLGPTILPASMRPQMDAFTRLESDAFWCAPQFPSRIFSEMSASNVGSSGTLRSASAKHISAIPSAFDRPNSRKKASSVPDSLARALLNSTSWDAFVEIDVRLALNDAMVVPSESSTSHSDA